MPSHDLNVIGLAGVAAPEDGTDISVPSVQVAALGGSLNAISGILMALYARERSGKGQLVNVDLYSSAINELGNQCGNYGHQQRHRLPRNWHAFFRAYGIALLQRIPNKGRPLFKHRHDRAEVLAENVQID